MKIQYIITLPDIGGAQSHLLELIDTLKKEHKIQLIVGKHGWLTDRLAEMNITYIVEPSLAREINPCNDFKAIYRLTKHIRSFQPDIVHCHSSKAGIVGRVAAQLAHVPVVFTAHGWAFTEGVPEKKRNVFAFIERLMFRYTNKVICVSDYDSQLARKAFNYHGAKLLTIHNGIKDTEYIKKQYGSHGVVMVSRFAVPKDQLTLVKAVKNLCNRKIAVRCVLIGDGPNLEMVKKYVKANVLDSAVTFAGVRTDIEELLIQSDIFCLISNYEGLPISIIEAMRAGLPIIASDVGGVHELVENDYNGYLVEKSNPEDLENKLLLLLNNSHKIREMGLNSRKKYKQEFSSGQMLKKIEAVYDECSNQMRCK